MAKKSKRKRARKRPGGGAGRGGPVAERAQMRAAVSGIRQLAEEAHDPATPPSRVAEILATEFDGRPAPHGFVRALVEGGSRERAEAVVAQLDALAPGSPTALTLEAEAAVVLDGDTKRASRLLDEALELDLDRSMAVPLGQHLLEAGRAREALELATEELFFDPLDSAAQELQGEALTALHEGLQTDEGLGEELDAADARASLAFFGDRAPIYRLREALSGLVEGSPELFVRQAQTVSEWLQSAFGEQEDVPGELTGASETRLAAEKEAIVRIAIEYSWLQEPDDDDLEDLSDQELLQRDEGDPDLSVSQSPLALLARAESTPADLADAAEDWHETCCWGLWLLEDPRPAPGVWLTEIVSGARRYVEIAPEQTDGLARWSVLLGAIVFLEGVWHTTGTFISLSPQEGDGAAALVGEAASDLMRVLSGKRARGPRSRRAEPHGVLAELREQPDPSFLKLISKFTVCLLPSIAGGIRTARETGPRLTNTEGQALKMITAVVAIEGALTAAAERLAAHPDFRHEPEEQGLITWWGRELSAAEREQMLESLRAELDRDGDGELEIEPDEPQRWLRGRLRPVGAAFEVEVNSEERLEALLSLLSELGLAPRIERRSAIDPSQDLPLWGARGPLGFGETAAAVETWARHWPERPTPALAGLSPRTAAARDRERPRLEALLRTLEHDADQLERSGKPVPDLRGLRAELAMECWWEPLASAGKSGGARRRRRRRRR